MKITFFLLLLSPLVIAQERGTPVEYSSGVIRRPYQNKLDYVELSKEQQMEAQVRIAKCEVALAKLNAAEASLALLINDLSHEKQVESGYIFDREKLHFARVK